MRKKRLEQIYEKPGAPWTSIGPPKKLAELIESERISPGKAIDIGCGEGFNSIYLSSKGFDVLGIDLSENAIQYAKENATNRGVNLRFESMDIADLEQLNEKFDFVLEWGLLHQIMPPERQKYVEDVAELLNRGGKYLSACFNEQSPEFGGPGRKYRESPGGTRLYFSSQDELRELFEPHFRVIEDKIIRTPHIENYFLLKKP